MTVEEELAAFLSEPDIPAELSEIQDPSSKTLPVDITLTTSSMPPRIGVVWPQGDGLKSVDFALRLNGVIDVLSDDADDKEAQKIKKVLEISEDIGVLVEWLNSGR